MEKSELADCSLTDVLSALKRLGDFQITEGGKHYVIKHPKMPRPITLQYQRKVDQNILRHMIKHKLIAEMGLTEEQIYEHLHC